MDTDKKKKITPEEEDKMVESAFKDLLDGYLKSNHRKKVEIIERAYKFAKEAHKGIRRRSGEPYIMHPIAVAKIVSKEIGLGSTSICAALLHDVVEDMDFTTEDIKSQFGAKIANIVEGLTKISGGIFGDKASLQAENFRKLLLTMSDDIRVILIKMADRLHNMRTLGSMLPSKQYKIAGETLYIYAPLAHRLGLYAIKTELEDLSFKYEHPEPYKVISNQLANSAAHREDIYNRFTEPIKVRLDKMKLKYEMKARVKSVYSIWNKMQTKKIPFDEVYDLYAVRIVFKCPNESDEKHICWNIYSEITDLYRLHPDRTRDWLSTPKSNGYRALHLTVMGPDGNWIEVQIRSERMDEIAEHGFAAHWKYKIGEGEEEPELAGWLRMIQDTLDNPEPNAIDFLDSIKLNLFSSEIVVFTPKGDLITLPKNASVLDLAFNLHSELGTHCIAGKVNHKLVPLSHKLQSGDQVEVLTSHSQQPQEEWTKYVVTAKAKSRLRAALRKDRHQIVEEGESMLQSYLEKNSIEFDNQVLTKILGSENLQSKEELYYMIGNNEIALSQELIKKIKPKSKSIIKKIWRFGGKNGSATSEPVSLTPVPEDVDTSKPYVLHSENGISNYRLAKCCNPIPGDDVLGYIDENRQLIIHKLDCPEAMQLKAGFGSRILSTKWAPDSNTFLASVSIEGIDRMGILQEIISEISTNLAINIRKLDIGAENGVFSCVLLVLVNDVNVVNQLCKKIKKIKGVNQAVRIDQ